MNRTFCGSTFMLDSADMKNILDGFPMTSAFTPEAYCKYNENDKFDSTHRMTLSHSLSVLTAIFPGTRVSRFYWSKGWCKWLWQVDNWSYEMCKAPVKSTPTNQHPTFYRPDALPVARPTVSEHWMEKYRIPWLHVVNNVISVIVAICVKTWSTTIVQCDWPRLSRSVCSTAVYHSYACLECLTLVYRGKTVSSIAVRTSCAGGHHNMPPPPARWPLTFWPWKWCPSHVRWATLCQF